MDTESIVRRIFQLKKASVELKQITEQPKSVSRDLISTILKIGMQNMSNEKQQTSNSESVHMKRGGGQMHSEKGGQVGDFLKKILENSQRNVSQNEGEKEKSMEFGRVSQYLTPAQQIDEFRTQNLQIQDQIKRLKQELHRLQEIQKLQMEEEWRDGLPYFVLTIPKLKAFYTRLTISEQDYDKIDYNLYSADLNLQSLTLSRIPQSLSMTQKSLKSIKLMLIDIKQVVYTKKSMSGSTAFTMSKKRQDQEDYFLIVYHFKQKKAENKPVKQKKKSAFLKSKGEQKKRVEDDVEIVETLFLKFSSEEQFKQWDLGVYINFKIMEELQADQKIENNFFNEQPKPKPIEKTNSFQFSELFSRLADKKNAEESPPKVKYPFEDVNQIYEQQKNDNNLPTQLIIESPQLEKNSKIKIKEDQSANISKILENGDQEQIANKQRSDTSHFGNSYQNIQSAIKQAQQLKIQENQEKRRKALENQERKKKQAERMEELKKRQYEISIDKAKQSLMRGYKMTKYAKSALNPYQKRVYLSQDGAKLYWEDIKSPGQLKFILIDDIVKVCPGKIGKGVEAHLKPKQINKKGRFVLIQVDSKDRKDLQLSTQDEFQLQQFCKQLQLWRKRSKQVSYF